MSQLIAKQWYMDAPYEARMEDPAMWTKKMIGNYVEPSYSGIPQVKWEGYDESHIDEINMEFFRYMEPNMYGDILEVTLKGGETFRTNKIQQVGKREFRCKPEDGDKYRTFGYLDYERIEAVRK